jgi:hypothetical protein
MESLLNAVLSTMADYFWRPTRALPAPEPEPAPELDEVLPAAEPEPAPEPDECLRYGETCIGRRMVAAHDEPYNEQANRWLDDIFKYILPGVFPDPGAISASCTHSGKNPVRTITIASSEPFHLTCDSEGYFHVIVPMYASADHTRVNPQVETLANVGGIIDTFRDFMNHPSDAPMISEVQIQVPYPRAEVSVAFVSAGVGYATKNMAFSCIPSMFLVMFLDVILGTPNTIHETYNEYLTGIYAYKRRHGFDPQVRADKRGRKRQRLVA